MRTSTLLFFLTFVSLTLSAEYEDKACKNNYCTEWEWYNNRGRFDPLSIKWPLHHTGENYKDHIDGGSYKLEVLYHDHKSNKNRSDLHSYRRSIYCPDPWFLKEGIEMEKPFECHEEAKNRPHWEDSNCSLIATNYTDQVVYVDGPGCSKTLRHWVIVDWCKYKPNVGAENKDDKYALVKDIIGHTAYFAFASTYHGVKEDGYYTFTQVIKVVDYDAPRLWSCAELEIDLEGKCEGKVYIKNIAEDTGLCPGEKVEITAEVFDQWKVLRTKKWFYTKNNEEFSILTNTLQAGDYLIKWKITDGCNNTSYCEQVLKVRDKTPPQMVCIQNISSSISDADGVTIWANDFVRKLDGPCFKGNITVSFSPDKVETGRHFDCETGLGIQGMNLYAWDQFGNQTSCYVEFFISDHYECDNGMQQIGGAIFNRFERPFAGAEIQVTNQGNEVAFTTSNSRGLYNISGIPKANVANTLSANIPDDKTNGIDEKDLIKLLRHVTGIEKFKHVMEFAAADINDDELIDMQDYFALVAIKFQLPSREIPYRAWKFVDSKKFYGGFTKASLLTEPIPIRHFKHRYDIVALKTGDIDYSWKPELTASSRSTVKSNYQLEEQSGIFTYDLQIPAGISLHAMTIPLSTLDQIESIVANHQALEFMVIDKTQSAEIILAEGVEGTITIKSNKALELSRIPAVINGRNGQLAFVQIQYTLGASIVAAAMAVSPNPFIDQFTIELWSPATETAQFELIDINGRLMHKGQLSLTKDYNHMQIIHPQSLNSGIYILRIIMNENILSQMVVKQ